MRNRFLAFYYYSRPPTACWWRSTVSQSSLSTVYFTYIYWTLHILNSTYSNTHPYYPVPVHTTNQFYTSAVVLSILTAPITNNSTHFVLFSSTPRRQLNKNGWSWRWSAAQKPYQVKEWLQNLQEETHSLRRDLPTMVRPYRPFGSTPRNSPNDFTVEIAPNITVAVTTRMWW